MQDSCVLSALQKKTPCVNTDQMDCSFCQATGKLLIVEAQCK